MKLTSFLRLCPVFPWDYKFMQQEPLDPDPPKRDQDDLSKPKNMKNIYIQKLTKYFGLSRENLIEVEEASNNEEPLSNPPLRRVTKSSININGSQAEPADKLEKNRESARKARKRKKLYVKLLEKQVQKYKDIAHEGKQLEKDFHKFMHDLREHVTKKKELTLLKPVITNNMVNVVSFSTQFKETDISAVVNNYQSKFGPSSIDRFEAMDATLKEIKDMFLPTHINTIMASESDNLLREMEKSKSGKHYNLEETRDLKAKIDLEGEKLNHSLNVLKQTIDMAKEELREINGTLEEMNHQHGCIQTSRFLLMIEQESNKPSNIKEFRQFLEQLNFDSVKQNDEQRYSFIFKDDLKRNILIKGRASEDLIRRINIYLDREIA